MATTTRTLSETRLVLHSINLWLTWMLCFAAIGAVAGLYAFARGHMEVYGVFREVPWGILISTYAFFAITSTGLCLLAAIGHAFGGTPLAPLGNRAVFLSIVTILSGFFCIGLELENPWRMLLYNVISPNLSSNIWWMGTLYGMAVACMLAEFAAILMGRLGAALAIGALGALAEVGANTNLGAVFATLSARPFWYGAQLPVYFLCSAVMSGAAAIILFTHLSHKLHNTEMSPGETEGLRSAGKVLALTLFLLVVATVWRFISFFTGGNDGAIAAAQNLLSGPLATNFWVFETIIGLIIPLFILVGTRMENMTAMSAAAIMALVGAFFQRYDLVVAGQEVSLWFGIAKDAPTYLGYIPSPGELLVVLGGMGVCGAGFLLGERFFAPIFTRTHH